MPTRTGSVNQPGYSDVADFLVELTRTWGGGFSYAIRPDRDRRGDPRLCVLLERKPWTGNGDDRSVLRVWDVWPTNGHLTFAGLLFKLCYQIDSKLEQRAREREAQTSF